MLSLIGVFLPAFASAQDSVTYSDVRVIEESGDLIGTELTLQVENGSARGTLRHYEGVSPQPIGIAGHLAGNALEMTGSYSEGTV